MFCEECEGPMQVFCTLICLANVILSFSSYLNISDIWHLSNLFLVPFIEKTVVFIKYLVLGSCYWCFYSIPSIALNTSLNDGFFPLCLYFQVSGLVNYLKLPRGTNLREWIYIIKGTY